MKLHGIKFFGKILKINDIMEVDETAKVLEKLKIVYFRSDFATLTTIKIKVDTDELPINYGYIILLTYYNNILANIKIDCDVLDLCKDIKFIDDNENERNISEDLCVVRALLRDDSIELYDNFSVRMLSKEVICFNVMEDK